MTLQAQDHPYLAEGQPTLPLKLGINGAGRIGKLTIWHHVARRSFQELVVNIGREAGRGMEDLLDYLARDSTYGSLQHYIHGFRGTSVVEEVDAGRRRAVLNGVPVTFLQKERNPKDVAWSDHDVGLVVECTGVFRDPTRAADHPKGAARGHLEAGARKVIVSAPFKIKDKSLSMPEDAVTVIKGINDGDYDPRKHAVISTASCTTTCLAYMFKPLLDAFGADPILGASMVTVHATTGSQEVLDRLPPAGADDLRKNRGILNNIILTSTGAAKALGLVIPEINEMGFSAEAVRIPNNTGSLIVLTVSLQNEHSGESVTPEEVNAVYQRAAEGPMRQYLSYTESQNVSSDIIGTAAAAIIEGTETRAYTAPVRVRLNEACTIVPEDAFEGAASSQIQIPVSQVVVYGWYDNELGSYTNMLGEKTIDIARELT